MKRVVILAAMVTLCRLAATAQTPISRDPGFGQTQAPSDEAINPDRPGIADGSGVVGRGRFQLEVGYQYERHRTETGASTEPPGTPQTERAQFVPMLLRVGLSSRWEARVEGNTFTRVDILTPGTTNDAVSGFSPISLGAKFHILDSAGPRPLSLGTIARVFPRSGTGSFHASRTTGDVRLAADWEISSSLSLNPNVGAAWYEDDEGERVTAALVAVTLGYVTGARTINPFVDLAVQSQETSGGEAAVTIDGGVAYLPTRNLQLDVSVGAGAHGRTPPQFFFSAGVSMRFDAKSALQNCSAAVRSAGLQACQRRSGQP